MNQEQARKLAQQRFTQPFYATRFLKFTGSLLNRMYPSKALVYNSQRIKGLLALQAAGVEGETS